MLVAGFYHDFRRFQRINKKDKQSKSVKSDSPITDKENGNIVDQTSENTLIEDQIKSLKKRKKKLKILMIFVVLLMR